MLSPRTIWVSGEMFWFSLRRWKRKSCAASKAACDLAFVGGSLLAFGGQNLIEACAVGKPVLIGPHTYNFTQASNLAVEQGAAIRIQDANGLADTLQRLFLQPADLLKMANAGLAFVKVNQGATKIALDQAAILL